MVDNLANEMKNVATWSLISLITEINASSESLTIRDGRLKINMNNSKFGDLGRIVASI